MQKLKIKQTNLIELRILFRIEQTPLCTMSIVQGQLNNKNWFFYYGNILQNWNFFVQFNKEILHQLEFLAELFVTSSVHYDEYKDKMMVRDAVVNVCMAIASALNVIKSIY